MGSDLCHAIGLHQPASEFGLGDAAGRRLGARPGPLRIDRFAAVLVQYRAARGHADFGAMVQYAADFCDLDLVAYRVLGHVGGVFGVGSRMVESACGALGWGLHFGGGHGGLGDGGIVDGVDAGMGAGAGAGHVFCAAESVGSGLQFSVSTAVGTGVDASGIAGDRGPYSVCLCDACGVGGDGASDTGDG